MRTIVHATLNFGAIYVPVGVATAQKRAEVSFRTLHVDCGRPIKLSKGCPTCNDRLLTEDDLVSGYEVAKDTYVIVDDDVREALKPAREKMLTITKFVDYQEVDQIMVEKSYWLTPNAALHRPYELLVTSMAEEGLVGIGRSTLWGKEYPVVFDSDKGALAMRTLYCADEITGSGEIASMLDYDVPKEEKQLMKQFMKLRRDTLTVEDLTNSSRVAALEILSQLADGQKVEAAPPPKVEPVTANILETLKEMVK